MWAEKNGRTWRIREAIGGEKITIAFGYATKTEANKALILLKADQLKGDSLIPRGGEKTLNEWLDMWWPVYKAALKITSQVSTQGVIDRYLRAMLGHHTLNDLQESPLIVQGWVSDLLEGRTKAKRPIALAPKTVRNAHGVLYLVMGAAIIGHHIRHNPCEHTVLPEESDTEMMFMDYDEADRLVQATPAYWRPLIAVFLATGLRWSEAMGLKVRDIDVRRHRLYVRVNTVEIGGRFVDQTPKTKRGRRYVSYQPLITELVSPLLTGKGPDDRVFTAVKGGPIRHKEFYAVWHKIRADAGLDGLRVHDLRHTHIAWLISVGVPLSAISRRAGHKSISVTDGRYGHLLPEVDEGIVAAIESAMAKIDFRENVGESGPIQPHDIPSDPMASPDGDA